jgi:hypothetical protein
VLAPKLKKEIANALQINLILTKKLIGRQQELLRECGEAEALQIGNGRLPDSEEFLKNTLSRCRKNKLSKRIIFALNAETKKMIDRGQEGGNDALKLGWNLIVWRSRRRQRVEDGLETLEKGVDFGTVDGRLHFVLEKLPDGREYGIREDGIFLTHPGTF